MTIHDIRPVLGATYRRRSDGMPGRVLLYRADYGRNLVVLLMDNGDTLHLSREDFWADFCHAAIFDTRRN